MKPDVLPPKQDWCASCTEDCRETVLRREGHDGGWVWLCPACDPQNDARTKFGRPIHRGYDVPDKDPGRGSMRERFRVAANRVAPVAVTTTRTRWSGGTASPGFIIVSVRREQNGRKLDRQEALQTLRDQPWHKELRHIGTDARFHVFERPDSDLARRVRGETNYDPIKALEQIGSRGKR